MHGGWARPLDPFRAPRTSGWAASGDMARLCSTKIEPYSAKYNLAYNPLILSTAFYSSHHSNKIIADSNFLNSRLAVANFFLTFKLLSKLKKFF